MIVSLHFGFAALWLGCVFTEIMFERALLPGGKKAHLTLADLHARVDKFIELPAAIIVLATGIYLYQQAPSPSAAYYTMVGAGLVAIMANFYCAWIVFRRQAVAHAGDWETFHRLDHMQHKVGAIVLLGLVVAIVAGILARA